MNERGVVELDLGQSVDRSAETHNTISAGENKVSRFTDTADLSTGFT